MPLITPTLPECVAIPCECVDPADMTDAYADPDGPAPATTDTGQTYEYFPATDWLIIGEKLFPNNAGGPIADISAFVLPQPTGCCSTVDPVVPLAPIANWFAEFNIYDATFGVPCAFAIGFINGNTLFSDMIAALFTTSGAPVTLLTTGPAPSVFPNVSAGATLPVDGSLIRVVLASNGFAAYVDGVPNGFISTAALAALAVDTSVCTNMFMFSQGAGEVSLGLIDNLNCGCADEIDLSPFI